MEAALALAHGSRVTGVEGQLTHANGQATGPSDVVRWVSGIWNRGPHAAAGTAAACLQGLSWETAVPKLSGALRCAGFEVKTTSGADGVGWRPIVPRVAMADG